MVTKYCSECHKLRVKVGYPKFYGLYAEQEYRCGCKEYKKRKRVFGIKFFREVESKIIPPTKVGGF